MLMRISGSVLLLFSLTACYVSEEAATATAPVVATCPMQLTSATQLPAGARLLGKIAEPLTLWDAEVSMGAPDDVAEDRALSTLEQDEEGPLPGKRYRYRYEVLPSKTDIPGEFERYLLACSYGASAKLAALQKDQSALLLIPLPYKANARCDVVRDQSDPGNQKRPLISATCESVK
jgi:hypothetical protein